MSGSRYNHRRRSGSLTRSPNRDTGGADIQALTQEPPNVSSSVFLLDKDPSILPLPVSSMHSSGEGLGSGLNSEGSMLFPASLGQDWMSSDNHHSANTWPVSSVTACDQCSIAGQNCQQPTLDTGQQSCSSCIVQGYHCSLAHLNTTGFTDDLVLRNDFEEFVAASYGSISSSNSASQASDSAPPVKIIAKPPPKIGTRFSRDSTKFLNRWLHNHENYPYPSREDIKTLQLQTGLNKTQIQNWLANTRRRQKKQGGSTGQSRYVYPRSTSDPLDAPLRPGTPAIRSDNNFRDMNPLQRWVESPPDREPATVKDIARAVASSPPRPSDTNDEGQPEDSLAPSVNDSSASSRGTSSGSSFGSAHSHSSGSSLGGLAPFARKRRRSKRARVKAKTASLAPIRQQLYQCTFCTETFLTKHDWQRHEKSLHIPLERWECSPNGPYERNPATGKTHCGFCGELDPSDSHIESHQPNSCQERAFNRKDYLRQHLRLVHKSALIQWVADIWKTPTPEVRSRCGFCGENLNTWDERVEHLAEHFKLGLTMAEWTGDWGFDDAIVHTLENSIPPYLIHNERTSPYPFEASNQSPESPRSAYELLTLELSYFVGNYQFQHGKPPDNATMVVEACRIIFASEILSVDEEPGSYPSWLRDLIMSDHNLAFQARVMPIRTPSEGRLRTLQLRGKRNLFEDCPLESQLRSFVSNLCDSGFTGITDIELRDEACHIMKRVEDSLAADSGSVFKWLLGQIHTRATWLGDFRKRAGLTDSHHVGMSTSHDMATLSGDLFPFELASPEPISEASHGFQLMHNQSEAAFNLQRTGRSYPSTFTSLGPSSVVSPRHLSVVNPPDTDFEFQSNLTGADGSSHQLVNMNMNPAEPESYERPEWLQNGNYILNDPNFHRWLGLELQRWVSIISSPQHPNPRIPSDQEIQDQARWLLYNDDDSWNQTAADNPEWLMRFKRDAGIDQMETSSIKGSEQN
ncbi:unnamed protein product [Clonostachys chloroleuca]|uniref:Uncharacterized protein n=1 Tax=Clonostachys chloroleuca TaxID=1926264 RepID=A0AA35MFK5_9HYPO|nr:unnamed protein product [Clonostachys chloroleuca]